jgi:hypothetical protein
MMKVMMSGCLPAASELSNHIIHQIVNKQMNMSVIAVTLPLVCDSDNATLILSNLKESRFSHVEMFSRWVTPTSIIA